MTPESDESLASEDVRIPYVHGRDLLPIRKIPIEKHNRRFAKAFAEEDRIRAEINELDTQVLRMSQRRKQLLDRLRDVQESIRPRFLGMSGRRRRKVSHEEALPPARADATRVIGRELRSLCLNLLGMAEGSLTLRQLHCALHRFGYLIQHRHPAKALADALGHETDEGRTRRVARGTYALVPGVVTTALALPDW